MPCLFVYSVFTGISSCLSWYKVIDSCDLGLRLVANIDTETENVILKNNRSEGRVSYVMCPYDKFMKLKPVESSIGHSNVGNFIILLRP